MGFSEYIVSAPFVQTFETGFASVISKDGTSARWASSMSCLYKALLAGRDGNRNRLCALSVETEERMDRVWRMAVLLMIPAGAMISIPQHLVSSS